MANTVATTCFIISDTHGAQLEYNLPTNETVDVAIHCGDLTEESKLEEFEASLRMLKKINAALKLVIAGNHDFTLDDPIFNKKIAELKRISGADDTALIKREYGAFGEARALFEDAQSSGIMFLEEGTHHFTLDNGARLKVFASPHTPSTNDWGFQYDPCDGRKWNIEEGTDIVITHGPPKGILDLAGSGRRAGCPDLFGAIARSRPRMHCFGHIHRSWGAKDVAWRDEISDLPNHFTDIDNDKSSVIGNLASIAANASEHVKDSDEREGVQRRAQGHCVAPTTSRRDGDPARTLFVNAAIQGEPGEGQHLPWLVTLALPVALVHGLVKQHKGGNGRMRELAP